MPVRSNIFQRLVAAIHSELGPGWRVTESRLLEDSRTGEQREVDVVTEASIGGYPMIISVELRDRGRRADVTWVRKDGSEARRSTNLEAGAVVANRILPQRHREGKGARC